MQFTPSPSSLALVSNDMPSISDVTFTERQAEMIALPPLHSSNTIKIKHTICTLHMGSSSFCPPSWLKNCNI